MQRYEPTVPSGVPQSGDERQRCHLLYTRWPICVMNEKANQPYSVSAVDASNERNASFNHAATDTTTCKEDGLASFETLPRRG